MDRETRQELKLIREMIADIQRRLPRDVLPLAGTQRSVRIAQTYDNGEYPGTGPTWPIKFYDGTFTDGTGSAGTFTGRDNSHVSWVYNLHGAGTVIPIGTKLAVWTDRGKWFCEWVDTADLNAIVRVTADTKNAACLWPGKLVSVVGGVDMCDPFEDGVNAWIVALNDVPNLEPRRYLARFGGTFDYSGDERPVYLVEDQATTINAAIVKPDSITGDQCVWEGTLQVADPEATDWCVDNLSNGQAVYLTNIDPDDDTMPVKDYAAIKLLDALDLSGDERPLYAIIKPFPPLGCGLRINTETKQLEIDLAAIAGDNLTADQEECKLNGEAGAGGNFCDLIEEAAVDAELDTGFMWVPIVTWSGTAWVCDFEQVGGPCAAC